MSAATHMAESGNALMARLPEVRGSLRADVPLAPLAWMRVGGPAEILFKPADQDDLRAFLAECPADIPVTTIGVASNLLVRDGGIPGVVIRLGRGFNQIEIEGTSITAGAGAVDASVAKIAAKAGIAGLEFFVGIPGTIGGALRMNGGAYGTETRDVLEFADVIDRNGSRYRLTADQMGMSYRHSDVAADPVFVSARFNGAPGDADAITARMEEISRARSETQPIKERTGGSTFANPDGHKAWQVIDQAGCRGLKVGAAQMSELHCNFMINTGGATATDMEALGEEVRRRVREQLGVELRWEIKRVGLPLEGAPMVERVLVLYGGWSAEREVSLTSGEECAKALIDAGFAVEKFDVSQNVRLLIDALDPIDRPAPDVVFNALHGRGGEDGIVQGVLEMVGRPYSHSGVRASSLAMDKPLAKTVFEAVGIQVPTGDVIRRKDLASNIAIAPPFVIKPAEEGSSVGVEIVREGDNRPAAYASSEGDPEDRLLVEPFVPGRELTVGVMGDRPLTVTEIKPRSGFYDYRAKYTEGVADHAVPADLPAEVFQTCLDHAAKAHQCLGCNGVSRSDFRFDDSKDGVEGLFLLELNTQPGMTPLSLVPEQAAFCGIDFSELCAWIVENARCPN